jgi:hypothetical protein
MAAWKDGELEFKIILTLALDPRVVAARSCPGRIGPSTATAEVPLEWEFGKRAIPNPF